ncbi:hypothetical protein ANN_19759 [Periplaneta americana]|uniref:Uncharacterized protein n=1 Tax=Periplaneta americana TaxID=6978 RepID=A0ABQ8SBB9_PERAM|nr:hypothetical protein ANN_19759 [Periplaneta americana]
MQRLGNALVQRKMRRIEKEQEIESADKVLSYVVNVIFHVADILSHVVNVIFSVVEESPMLLMREVSYVVDEVSYIVGKCPMLLMREVSYVVDEVSFIVASYVIDEGGILCCRRGILYCRNEEPALEDFRVVLQKIFPVGLSYRKGIRKQTADSGGTKEEHNNGD